MPKFIVTLVRDIMVAADIEVVAKDEEEAADKAVTQSWTIDKWEEVSNKSSVEVDLIKRKAK